MRISDWSSDVCSSDLRLRIQGKFNRGRAQHIGHADVFKRAPDNSVDALPISTYVAPGFDRTGTRCSGAFGQPERLLFKSVYNVSYADLIGGPPKGVTATGAPAAFNEFALAQQFQ